MDKAKTTNYINPIRMLSNSVKIPIILVILYLCICNVSYLYAQRLSDQLIWRQFIEEKDVQGKESGFVPNPYYICIKDGVSSGFDFNDNLTIVRRLSANSFVVYINTHEKYQAIAKMDFQLYSANNLWKLNDDLLSMVKDASAKEQEKHVYLKFQEEIAMINELVAFYSMTHVAFNIYEAHLSKETILQLIDSPALVYVGAESNDINYESTVLDLNLHPNRVNALHHYYPGFRGQDELVSIQEPLYDINDIDLSDRYKSLNKESEFSDRHATEMATIIAGAGNSFVTGAGVAPAASHTSADNLSIVPQPADYYSDNNITVQNHSYGTEIENFYGALAYSYDQNSFDEPNILHIQSVGNSGEEESKIGPYANIVGYSNLTGNYKQAKNVISVGSVDTTGRPVSFSSAGPAYDGRVKPELVTYGVTGTSNSAALVSGTLVLLQQYYKQKFNEPLPSALAKALLINTADEAGASGIDFKTGYGQLNALAAIEAIEANQFIKGSIKSGEIRSYPIQVPKNAVNLKLTIVWLDAPANINDQVALQNDLDLELRDFNGTLYLPEILNSFPSVDSLALLSRKGKDHLNNVEQIRLIRPEAGAYTCEVSPYQLKTMEQSFYLIYQYDIADTFRWTSPTGSDNISYNGETTSHIRWESSFDLTSKAGLYYKDVQSDADWLLIADQIDLSAEQYRWKAPALESKAILKMEIEGQAYLSDTFTVSTPLRIGVAYNCSDSLLLTWSKHKGANQYQFNQLVNGQLEELLVTKDTSIVLYKDAISSDYFQLVPKIDQTPFLQSFTINYQLQGAGCYINSLFSYVEQDSGIFIVADLGYAGNMEKVILEKKINNEWLAYKEQTALSNDLKFLDQEPNNGLNTYRLKLLFNNATQIVTEETSGIFVKDEQFIIYPNPISTQEELKVFAKSVRQLHTFELFTASGNSLMLQYFNTNRAYIDLPLELNDGLYIYHIYTKDNSLISGKLLIRN